MPISEKPVNNLKKCIEKLDYNTTKNKLDNDSDKEFGTASKYIMSCWNEYELINKADVEKVKKLIELDSKRLKKSHSQNFRECLLFAARLDLIKV